MGEAKRRRNAGWDPESPQRRLAAAWLGDGDEFEDDVLEEILSGPSPERVLAAAEERIEEASRPAFAAEMLAAAGRIDLRLEVVEGFDGPDKPDGPGKADEPYVPYEPDGAHAEFETFAVSVEGFEGDLRWFLDSGGEEFLLEDLRSSGLVGAGLPAAVCPIPLTARRLAVLSPVDLRKVAVEILENALGNEEEAWPAARRIFACETTEEHEDDPLAPSFIVCGRLRPIGSEEDGVGVCDFIDGEDEAEAEKRMEEHVSRSLDAAERFLDTAQARVEAEDFGFEFTDAALDWDEVLEDGALAWIRNDLDAASCALFPTERYDEISISEDGRDLVIEAKIQGIPFGPTRIPERLGRHALDLLSILMENGGRVVDRRGDDPAEAVGMDLGFGA